MSEPTLYFNRNKTRQCTRSVGPAHYINHQHNDRYPTPDFIVNAEDADKKKKNMIRSAIKHKHRLCKLTFNYFADTHYLPLFRCQLSHFESDSYASLCACDCRASIMWIDSAPWRVKGNINIWKVVHCCNYAAICCLLQCYNRGSARRSIWPSCNIVFCAASALFIIRRFWNMKCLRICIPKVENEVFVCTKQRKSRIRIRMYTFCVFPMHFYPVAFNIET